MTSVQNLPQNLFKWPYQEIDFNDIFAEDTLMDWTTESPPAALTNSINELFDYYNLMIKEYNYKY